MFSTNFSAHESQANFSLLVSEDFPPKEDFFVETNFPNIEEIPFLADPVLNLPEGIDLSNQRTT